MADTLRDALQERTTPGSVIAWVIVAGMFWLLFDGAVLKVAFLLVLLVGIDSMDLLSDVYGFSSAIKPLVVGIVGLSGIGAILFLESLAIFDEPGGVWQLLFLAVLAVAACWILFDGVRRLHHEGAWADDAG